MGEQLGVTLGGIKPSICSRFHWKSMVEDIWEFVKRCEQCQRINANFVKSNAKLHPIPVQAKFGIRWEQISLNLSQLHLVGTSQITSLKDAIFKKAKGNIDKAQDTYKKYYDKKHDDKRVFKPGSLVCLKNSAKESKKGDKMKPRWLGPYKVVECLDKGVMEIANPKTGITLKKAVNQCRLKHFYGLDDSKHDSNSSGKSPDESTSLDESEGSSPKGKSPDESTSLDESEGSPPNGKSPDESTSLDESEGSPPRGKSPDDSSDHDEPRYTSTPTKAKDQKKKY